MDKRRESKRVSKFRREVFDARNTQTSREIFEEVSMIKLHYQFLYLILTLKDYINNAIIV